MKRKEKKQLICYIIIAIIFMISLIAFNVWLTKEQTKGLKEFKGYTKEQCAQQYYNYINNKNN